PRLGSFSTESKPARHPLRVAQGPHLLRSKEQIGLLQGNRAGGGLVTIALDGVDGRPFDDLLEQGGSCPLGCCQHPTPIIPSQAKAPREVVEKLLSLFPTRDRNLNDLIYTPRSILHRVL